METFILRNQIINHIPLRALRLYKIRCKNRFSPWHSGAAKSQIVILNILNIFVATIFQLTLSNGFAGLSLWVLLASQALLVLRHKNKYLCVKLFHENYFSSHRLCVWSAGSDGSVAVWCEEWWSPAGRLSHSLVQRQCFATNVQVGSPSK